MFHRQLITTISTIVLSSVLLLSGCAPIAPLPAAAPAADDGAVTESMEAAPTTGIVRPTSPAATGASAGATARPWQTNQREPVTAGVVDDNAAWEDYMAYLSRHPNHGAIDIDVRERILIQVMDDHSRPVHDADIEIYVGDDVVFRARTDTAGRVIFLPGTRYYASQQHQADEFRVVAAKEWAARSQNFSRRDGDRWTVVIEDAPQPTAAQLDLLFLIDATGSMDDEIDKLKTSMAAIADAIARLPEQPDVRYGLVAYRDHGDAFVVRSSDFTDSLTQFQRTLARLEASGGGDEPEALHEALLASVHDLGWRDQGTVRMVVLVADAPPHIVDSRMDLFERYDFTVFQAVAQGIKIFPVGASGLNETGEYVFRQLAQITGGKFVFLTYADGGDPVSGPGTETEHDVETYSVNTLDRLVVRLVREELAHLGEPVVAQPRSPMPEPMPSSIRCNLDLARGDNSDCAAIGEHYPATIQVLEPGLLRITLDPANGFTRARFDIRYDQASIGYSVNIGDSASNNGDGGDDRDQSNDAELQILDNALSIFGNDYHVQFHQERLLYERRGGIAIGPSVYVVEIGDESVWLEGFDQVNSPGLFALSGQADDEGPVNYDIYAAFNRNIAGDRRGIGVRNVTVTLLGPQS